MSRPATFGLLVSLAGPACQSCPPGTVGQVNPWADTPLACVERPAPNPDCAPAWWCSLSQAARVDAGILELDAGAGVCLPVGGDPCSACAAGACCTQTLACLGVSCSPADPADPDGAALSTCIDEHCGAQCVTTADGGGAP